MRIVELKKDTFYTLPFELKYKDTPFDTIYVGKDGMMFIDSKRFLIEGDGVTLKELFKSKKGEK